MALIAVSGHPGCRSEEVARGAALRLNFDFLTQARLEALAGEEFGPGALPPKAFPALATSVLARLATARHLVYCAMGGEVNPRQFPGALRVHVVAPEAARIGNLMVDHQLDRQQARTRLLELEAQDRTLRRERFGKARAAAESFDMVLNGEFLGPEQMAGLVEAAATSAQLAERGLLSQAAEAQLQFQVRLKLARHGLAPLRDVSLANKTFAHPSEQMFANLLDFYRIAWEYEPRSFPIETAANGEVTEAFTPDFYLPEFNLYVELTTMKQSLVTRKNRKVRRLRELHPGIQIQVFYQKDFENLIFKYGLTGRPASL